MLETGGILEARQLYTKTCTDLFFSVLYKLNNLHTYGSTKKRKRSERKMINIKSKTQKGITLIALVVTTIFCYDEFIKSSNNNGFLLQTI